MDDPRLVGRADGPGQGLEQSGGLARRHRFLGEALAQSAPGGELEHQIRPLVVLTDAVDGDDIRVAEPGGGQGLGAEPIALAWVGVSALEHHLQRHQPVELRVAGLIDDPHAATAQDPEYLVVADAIRCRRLDRNRRVSIIGELKGRGHRGVQAELDHDRAGQTGESGDELVGVGALASLPPEHIFLVDEIQNRLRIVAKLGRGHKQVLDRHALAAVPSGFLIVEGLLQKLPDLRLALADRLDAHGLWPRGNTQDPSRSPCFIRSLTRAIARLILTRTASGVPPSRFATSAHGASSRRRVRISSSSSVNSTWMASTRSRASTPWSGPGAESSNSWASKSSTKLRSLTPHRRALVAMLKRVMAWSSRSRSAGCSSRYRPFWSPSRTLRKTDWQTSDGSTCRRMRL